MRPTVRAFPPRTGHDEHSIAENQTEYLPIVINAHLEESGAMTIVTRWKPDDEQRRAIAEGADIFVTMLNFGGGMTPLMVYVGPDELNRIYPPPPPPE